MVVTFGVGMTEGATVGFFVVSLFSCDIAVWPKMINPKRNPFHTLEGFDSITFTLVFRLKEANEAADLCIQFRSRQGKLPEKSDNKHCSNIESVELLV